MYLICAWCNVVVHPIRYIYIKPTMTGAGCKHGDNLGMVMTLGLSHYYTHYTYLKIQIDLFQHKQPRIGCVHCLSDVVSLWLCRH